jgi:hypothetical protein
VLSEKVPYYILDLLQQVPSVYVDGLGRFEAIFHPALIDLPHSRIKPPYVEPEFRDDQENPNATLAAYIRYVSGDEFGSPEEAIKQFVSTVRRHTEEGETYPIDKFGTFSRSSLGNIRFTPDWDAFNLSFSGLEVLDLKPPAENHKPATIYTPPPVTETSIPPAPLDHVIQPLVDETQELEIPKEPVHQVSAEDGMGHQDRIDETTSRLWWIILTSALILIAVLCAYLAWDILSGRNRLNDLKQTYPDTSTNTRISEVPAPADTVANVPSEVPVTQEPVEQQQTPVIEKPSQGTSPCYIVVGAFTDPSNITKMVDRLSSLGYTPEQLKGGSLTRVAIRTSCDQDSLQKTLNEARTSINPEAWIY